MGDGMAGVGKLVEELRRKLGEWAQAVEEALQGEPPRELVPVKVPVRGPQSGPQGRPPRR